MKRIDYIKENVSGDHEELARNNSMEIIDSCCPYDLIPMVARETLIEINEGIKEDTKNHIDKDEVTFLTMHDIMEGEGCVYVSPTESDCMQCWTKELKDIELDDSTSKELCMKELKNIENAFVSENGGKIYDRLPKNIRSMNYYEQYGALLFMSNIINIFHGWIVIKPLSNFSFGIEEYEGCKCMFLRENATDKREFVVDGENHLYRLERLLLDEKGTLWCEYQIEDKKDGVPERLFVDIHHKK